MEIDLRAGIVRILKADGTTAGTGFVVGDEGLIAAWARAASAVGARRDSTPRIGFEAADEG